jgi:hypothetical protein
MAHGYLRDWDEGWGSDNERERGQRGREQGGSERDRDRDSAFSFGGREDRGRSDWERAPRGFRSRQDDHYRSWRDKQIESLDRDYADYCREREQQFHEDFGEWRRRRAGNPQPLRTGMTQSGISHDPTGELQLTTDSSIGPVEPDPVSDATLGTNSADGAPSGRSRAKPDALS